jgi:hypothetical protein
MPVKSYSASVQVTATTTSAATAAPGGSGGKLEVVNLGIATVYGRIGASTVSVTADASNGTVSPGFVVPPNTILETDCDGSHVALVTASGTTSVLLMGGI